MVLREGRLDAESDVVLVCAFFTDACPRQEFMERALQVSFRRGIASKLIAHLNRTLGVVSAHSMSVQDGWHRCLVDRKKWEELDNGTLPLRDCHVFEPVSTESLPSMLPIWHPMMRVPTCGRASKPVPQGATDTAALPRS